MRLALLNLQNKFLLSDQVAQAHHSHNQNYPPFYLDITWKTRQGWGG